MSRAAMRMVRAEAVTRRQARAAAVKRICALSERMNLRIGRAEVRKVVAKGRD